MDTVIIGKTITIAVDPKTHKGLVDYKKRTGVSIKKVVIDAINEKVAKLNKEK